MKHAILLASALLIGTTHAASVSGSQTTPLTLQVNNFCQLGGIGSPNVTPDTFNRTFAPVNLGTINAVTKTTVNSVLVSAVDCNYKTALNVHTPAKVTLTNKAGDSFDITTDAWDAQHPLTMSFRKDFRLIDGEYGQYQFYGIEASFVLGGSKTLNNRAFSIPGGLYKGNLVVSYDYSE